MRIKRRIEIVCSSERIIAFKMSSPAPPVWCEECAAGARMLSPEAAAAAVGVAARTLYRWVEAGRVHFTEGRGGELFICLGSAFSANEPPDRDE